MNLKKMFGVSLFALCLFNTSSTYALDLHAFGDVTFNDSTDEEETTGFMLGQLDLWGTHVIDDDEKMRTFFELVIESPGVGFVSDLERLWVEYDLTPTLKIRGGRFHTSVGYWNRVHHHGAQMQTTVFRPQFLNFEDEKHGILPVHMIGLMGIADFESDPGALHFEVQFGNGTTMVEHSSMFENPSKMELDPGNAGDVDNSKSIASRFVFEPKVVDGFGIGLSYVINPVKRKKLIDKNYKSLVDQSVFAADFFYLENNVELIIEYYSIVNKDARLNKSGTSWTSNAWYTQIGYTFFELYTPYARYESFSNPDPNDPYFNDINDTDGLNKKGYQQALCGLRFDINSNSSLKIEGRTMTSEPGETNENTSTSYSLQWTFAF